LLTRQPPGREAYPGDVFYVHARLLERAAKLSKAAGGGSLTALPIAELDAGNLSAYIPTNLISITDGQIVLDARLFHEGHSLQSMSGPASAVSAAKHRRPLYEPPRRRRLDYAQFLELEMFTRFGGLTDVQVKGKITRGQRVRAVLSQPQYNMCRCGLPTKLRSCSHCRMVFSTVRRSSKSESFGPSFLAGSIALRRRSSIRLSVVEALTTPRLHS
jgi:F0F1-type ATP synthase alpha subunit